MTNTRDPLSSASDLIKGLQALSRLQNTPVGRLTGVTDFVVRKQAEVDRLSGEYFHSIKRSLETYYTLQGHPPVDVFSMTAGVINLMLELEKEHE